MEINGIKTAYWKRDTGKTEKNVPNSFAEILKEKTSLNENESISDTDLKKFIHDYVDDIRERLKNGDTEVKIQIGAESLSEEEWEKLLAEVDEIQEIIRKMMQAELEKEKEEQKMQEIQEEQAKFEDCMNMDEHAIISGKLFLR